MIFISFSLNSMKRPDCRSPRDWLLCFRLSTQVYIYVDHCTHLDVTFYRVLCSLKSRKIFYHFIILCRTVWFHFFLWAQPWALSLDFPCILIRKLALKVWNMDTICVKYYKMTPKKVDTCSHKIWTSCIFFAVCLNFDCNLALHGTGIRSLMLCGFSFQSLAK